MGVTAVVFDVGETLADETRNWERVADACGVPRFTPMALIGAAIAGGGGAVGNMAVEHVVGDRVDNDVLPALAAGRVAVHLQRGPWGYVHETPPAAIPIRSLEELPDAFGG